MDGTGTLYVADSNNNTIRKIAAGAIVTTLAGTAGTFGSTNGTGSAARFNGPRGLAVDGAGTVYVADTGNQQIRQVTAAAVVTTLAGSFRMGGSDGPAANARFNNPEGVTVDAAGVVYVADTTNDTIRKIAAGNVTTVAGFVGSHGSADGEEQAARFAYPSGVAVDSSRTIYVADRNNHTIRKISPTGVVTTFAGLADTPGSTRRDRQRRALQLSTRSGGGQRGDGVCRRHRQLHGPDDHAGRSRDHAGWPGRVSWNHRWNRQRRALRLADGNRRGQYDGGRVRRGSQSHDSEDHAGRRGHDPRRADEFERKR